MARTGFLKLYLVVKAGLKCSANFLKDVEEGLRKSMKSVKHGVTAKKFGI